MKKLLLLLFFPALMISQSPIEHYMGFYNQTICDSFGDWDGTCSRSYFIASNAADYNHDGTGEQTWVFNDFVHEGFVNYSNSAPTDEDLANFPGTTRIVTDSYSDGDGNTLDESRTMISDAPTAFQGLQGSGITFHYTDPAEIGSFPMDYGFSNTDEFSGTFEFDGTPGTFTGSIVSAYDAFGTVETNDLSVGDFAARRLKIIETINLEIPGLGNVGTLVQTRYLYYGALPAFPAIIAYTTIADLPLLGINDTSYQLHYTNPSAVLGTQTHQRQLVRVWPNPSSGELNINSGGKTISGYTIADLNARIVASAAGPYETIDISSLANGFYLLNISTAEGSSTIKIIKK